MTKPNPDNKGGYVTTIQSATNPNWERDIVARLRSILATCGKSIDEIFASFDVDGSGSLSTKEFRNAIRKFELGLTSKEIDRIMQRIDKNQDGLIDYREFFAVLGANRGYDRTMAQRTNNKLAELKEQMVAYLKTQGDAYRKFDQSKVGKMQYMDFSLLVTEMSQASNTPAPAYSVIKDLFDAVDIKKDGHIDPQEWSQTFNGLGAGGPQSSIKPTPLAAWADSAEARKVGTAVNKHRKALIGNFNKLSTHAPAEGQPKLATFSQAKKALDHVLYQELVGKGHGEAISDAKLKLMLSVGQVSDPKGDFREPMYDFMKVLALFKERYKPVV